MGRIKPIWQIEDQLENAKKREAYLKAKATRPIKQNRDAQPRVALVYTTFSYKVGSVFPEILLQASQKSVNFFGGAAALGLQNTPADLAEASAKPKGFKPTIIKAMVGDPTPTVSRDAQSHYQAPLSCGNQTPTNTELDAKVAAIKTAKQAQLGEYGRLYLQIESFSRSLV
jgi:hypothetical protein